MKVRVGTIGEERQPVIMIDDFVPDPAGLRRRAEALAYRPMGPHYPGLRAQVAREDIAAFLPPVLDLVRDTFGLSGTPGLVSAGYSIVTTPPARLTPIQRIPHTDGLEPERIALLHFLGDTAQGGTAFYRHRSTGYETITAARFAGYDAALRRDVAQHGLPPPDYISGDTPLFERIARIAAAPNRAIIYRSHSLHCADLPPDLDLTPDPKRARLTVNTFLMGPRASAPDSDPQ
jgi:hypothetical protein